MSARLESLLDPERRHDCEANDPPPPATFGYPVDVHDLSVEELLWQLRWRIEQTNGLQFADPTLVRVVARMLAGEAS